VHKLPPTGTIEIAPSILSADFARLAEDIGRVVSLVKMIHIDVMDGHLVPNITIGPVVVKKLRPHFDVFFDTHLMITDAAQYAPAFAEAGSDGITFHLEAVSDPKEIIKQLRRLNVSVGISIKPKTPIKSLTPVIELVDMVLLMSVEPGFGGQDFMPDSIPRCRELKKMLRPDQRLEVDGGIGPATAGLITRAGGDTLVAGNAIFAQSDPAAATKAIYRAAQTNS